MFEATTNSRRSSHYGRLSFVSSKLGNNAIKTIRSHAMLAVRQKQRHDRLEALKESRFSTAVPYSTSCKCILSTVEELRMNVWREPQYDATDTRTGSTKRRLAPSSWTCSICGNPLPFVLSKTGQKKPCNMSLPVVIPFLEHLIDPFNAFPHPSFKVTVDQLREIEEVKTHRKQGQILLVKEDHLLINQMLSSCWYQFIPPWGTILARNSRLCDHTYLVKLILSVIVLHFYSPGRVKSVTIPLAQNDLALLMSMLFAGLSNLLAKKNQSLNALALLVKGEAIRLINQKMKTPELAADPINLCSIMYVASGVRVRVQLFYACILHQVPLTLLLDFSRHDWFSSRSWNARIWTRSTGAKPTWWAQNNVK